MPLDETLPSRSPTRPRRTVKIVKQRSVSRAAWISLALVAAAAIAIPFMWTVSQSEPIAPATQTTFESTILDWRCDNGHTFKAPGRTGRRACPYCDAMASPYTQYTCPIHGAKDVEIQFEETKDGHVKIAKVRLVGRDWVPAGQQLRCPQCGRPLTYDANQTLRNKLKKRQQSDD